MSVTICVLFAAIIKCSTAEINLNTFTKAKGGDRALLQQEGQTITNQDTESATSISCDASDSGTYGTSPEYWQFYNPESQSVTFSNCATTFDTNLYVYNSALEWISEEVCDGDDCTDEGCEWDSLKEEFSMNLDPGTYYVELYPCCDPDNTPDPEEGDTYSLAVSCGPWRHEPTPAPTEISDDLSGCGDSSTVSIPATSEATNYWFTIDSTGHPIIGIDACDYTEGKNDFNFQIYLYSGAYEQLQSPDATTYYGDTPLRCATNGGGAYLEFNTEIYQTNWWVRVEVYSSFDSGRRLKLTRKCEYITTTQMPTPMPTDPTSNGDLSNCDFSRQMNIPVGNENLVYWFSIDSSQNSLIGIEGCENNDLYFDMSLYSFDNFEYNYAYADTQSNPEWCTINEYGAYLEFDAANYPETTSWWLKVDIYGNSNENANLQLTRRCAPTPEPTMHPTTEMPSRSPLRPGETHPPTTAMPTRPPTTKRPSTSPTTKRPSGSPTPQPTKPDKHAASNGAVNYSVIGNMICIVTMVIGILFV